jgi:hypothetical protein
VTNRQGAKYEGQFFNGLRCVCVYVFVYVCVCMCVCVYVYVCMCIRYTVYGIRYTVYGIRYTETLCCMLYAICYVYVIC